MKNIFLAIIREIGIAILILAVLAAVIVLAFKDQLPYDDVIPVGEKYVRADKKTYSVSSTDRISEIDAIKITHEANAGQIIEAENQIRIQTGKYTPFGTIDGSSDLPSERVGTTASSISSNSSSVSDEAQSSGDVMEYPDETDPIKKIEAEQSESSESAATRRFGSAE